MRTDKLQKTDWGVDGHPSTELLRQYEEGVLSGVLSHELERHLMDCELCEDILTGMTLTDRSQTQQAKTRILQRMKIRLRKHRKMAMPLHVLGDWRVAVAVLMMFCSLGLLLFYYYTRSMQEQAASSLAGYDSAGLPPSPEELLARTIDSALVLEIQAPPRSAVHQLPVKSDQATVSPEGEIVQGMVVSADGQGIAGVRIQVQGTSLNVTTETSGSFRIRVPKGRHTLRFSSPGYKVAQQEVHEPGIALRVQLEKDR
jgi:hypothetical protein